MIYFSFSFRFDVYNLTWCITLRIPGTETRYDIETRVDPWPQFQSFFFLDRPFPARDPEIVFLSKKIHARHRSIHPLGHGRLLISACSRIMIASLSLFLSLSYCSSILIPSFVIFCSIVHPFYPSYLWLFFFFFLSFFSWLLIYWRNSSGVQM